MFLSQPGYNVTIADAKLYTDPDLINILIDTYNFNELSDLDRLDELVEAFL